MPVEGLLLVDDGLSEAIHDAGAVLYGVAVLMSGQPGDRGVPEVLPPRRDEEAAIPGDEFFVGEQGRTPHSVGHVVGLVTAQHTSGLNGSSEL